MTTLTHDDCFPLEQKLAPPTLTFEFKHGRIFVQDNGRGYTHFDCSVTEPWPAMVALVNWISDQQGRRIPPPDGPEEAA